MGERVPTSYSQEPVVHGGTTHKPSWSRSGGGGVDGDGSGGQSPSRQGAGAGTSDPRNLSAMAAALRMFLWNMTDRPRVYTSGAIYRRRGNVGGSSWAPHHVVVHPGGDPRHHVVWAAHGPPAPLLLAPCSPLNYKFAAFCPVQFREYFLKYFSETEKQQKTGTSTVASCQ
jgi:hypothetical protein